MIFVSFAEMSLRYAILCSIIVDILDGSAYLFDKKAPERVSASERLARIEELIASVEKVSKKKDGVNVLIVTSGNGNLTDKDIAKFNSQYPKLTVKISKDFHDRFLIIDKKRGLSYRSIYQGCWEEKLWNYEARSGRTDEKPVSESVVGI